MNSKKENLVPTEISTEIPACPAGGSTEKNKKFVPNKKWLIVLVIILAVIIIVAAVLIIVLQEEKVEDGQENLEQEEAQQEVELPVRNGTMSLQTEDKDITVGETFQVNIVMDTQDSNIVVASADIIYDSEVLELVSVENQSSVLNMSILKDEKVGEIEIIRGAPGDADYDDSDDGYAGSDGILASLEFKILKTGSTEIEFNPEKSNMILDDGRGTEMAVEYNNLKLVVGN